MAAAIEARLVKLGLKIPTAAAPAANYVPWRRTGNLVFIAGQIPKLEDGSLMKGMLGSPQYSLDEGVKAAQLCGLNLIAQMKAACQGDLGKIKQIVKVEGFVASTPDFVDHPKVLNGCSDLMCEVFGQEIGQHARFAVGCSSLPLGVSVEIGAIVETEIPASM